MKDNQAHSYPSVSAIILVVVVFPFFYTPFTSADFRVTLLHTGDVHSRFEQFDSFTGSCSNEESTGGECYGGVARRATVINEIRQSVDNVILLDAGDQFQGSFWFNLYRGKATSHFMNRLGYQVQTIGNHEFDLGPDGLASYLKDVEFPVVNSNMDVSNERGLQGLFNKSTVLMVGGEMIGVVGYVLPATRYISKSGNVIFHDEIEAVQTEVDKLTAQGINKIIALGHSGFTRDVEVAAKVKGVDIVVGGHSTTFLYTGNPPASEEPDGDYPLLVTPEGKQDGNVLVVHAHDFGKYLGRLDATFDENGRLTQWSGNPILLNKDVKQDETFLHEVTVWGEAVRNLSGQVIGQTHVLLDGSRESCRKKECNLGNLITDAILWQMISFPDEERWNDVGIAVVNSGGIRSSIEQGEITYADIVAVLPFGNSIDLLELKGRHLKELLENSVTKLNPEDPPGRFLQMSGIWVTYDLSREPFDRVVEVLVRCTDCLIPEFVPLEEDTSYKIAMPAFLAEGGDEYDDILENAYNRHSGNLDASILADYIQLFSPVYPEVERRITFATAGGVYVKPGLVSVTCSLLAIMGAMI